ncbi:MAG TPA: hypothetical protein VH575_18070 [Gemmataceae bacterium]|jgi:hypothetical protein
MHVQLQLEELEERSVLSAADLASFQQQTLPSLQTQFQALVPLVQSTLQTNLNHLEALAPAFPAPLQPLLGALFAQQQQFVNAFPLLATITFQQTVANFEAQLLAQPAPPPPAPVRPAIVPVFFPFFPGFFGFPGAARFAGGGVGFTSGFTSGFSGFSGFSSGFSGGSGSGGGDPPTVVGQGMGAGLMTTAGALTLARSNHR